MNVSVTAGGLRDKFSHPPPLAGVAVTVATEPPPAASRCAWVHSWQHVTVVVVAVAALLATAITLGVLGTAGKLSRQKAAETYFVGGVRQRQNAAVPAFSAELHTWLLPSELAAMGASPSADVIVVGGGVAGLAAANALSGQSYNVIVLEARVSAPSAPPWQCRALAWMLGVLTSARLRSQAPPP